MLIGFDNPLQMKLVSIVRITVGVFHKVLTTATLAFQKRLGGTTRAFRRERVAAAHFGVAIDLERRFGAAPDADDAAFEEAQGRIEINRLPVG